MFLKFKTIGGVTRLKRSFVIPKNITDLLSLRDFPVLSSSRFPKESSPLLNVERMKLEPISPEIRNYYK